LTLLQISGQQRFDGLKPYLEMMTRNRHYRGILNQGARLFGEFLTEEIEVTETDNVLGE
jgi:hypothetical protein